MFTYGLAGKGQGRGTWHKWAAVEAELVWAVQSHPGLMGYPFSDLLGGFCDFTFSQLNFPLCTMSLIIMITALMHLRTGLKVSYKH